MPKAKIVFNELARLLGQASYFTGAEVSLADLLLAPAVAFFVPTPEWSVLGAPHPNLVAWLARMEARPSLQATTWERGVGDGTGGVSEFARAMPARPIRQTGKAATCCINNALTRSGAW